MLVGRAGRVQQLRGGVADERVGAAGDAEGCAVSTLLRLSPSRLKNPVDRSRKLDGSISVDDLRGVLERRGMSDEEIQNTFYQIIKGLEPPSVKVRKLGQPLNGGRMNRCPICTAKIPESKLMCFDHWCLVPEQQQAQVLALWQTMRRGRTDSIRRMAQEEYRKAREAAIAAVKEKVEAL